MTTPKALNTTYLRGSRFYVHPDSQEKVPGVTSVLNMLPKPFLKAWAAKEVATSAVRMLDGTEPDALTPMVASDPDNAIDWLKRAPDRNTRKAANIGTAAHGVFEALNLGQPLGAVTPDLEIFARQYADLLGKIQPETIRCEDTVWSEKHSYAGSFDALQRVQGELCWVDGKTTRSGVHSEVALQLSAYGHSDYVFDAETGAQEPTPQANRGLVYHVRPEGWAVYEVPIGQEVFEYFLHLRAIFTWDTAISRQIVGRPAVKGTVIEAGAA